MEPMTNQSNIERIVMRRVRLIRLLALVVSTATLAILTFVAALWGIGREVWVARILQNAPTDFAGLLPFYFTAFTNTHLIVQMLTLLTLISLIFLIRETARALSSAFSQPYP
ncbi:MAG: hypothetical protein Q7R58_00715 [bacterium]|nr:hypothetical protein [bacterium]